MEYSDSVYNVKQKRVKVGILAVQGDFLEHAASLKNAAIKISLEDVEIVEIRNVDQVNDDLVGLIIPGGESTVLSKHLKLNSFQEKLKSWTRDKHKFTWGTCAGLILLSETIQGDNNIAKIGGIDITCTRNAFGRQNDSFEAQVTLPNGKLTVGYKNDQYNGIFIRAPGIVSIDSDEVEVLCRLPGVKSLASDVIAVRQDNIMATTFHPELTDDTRWHEYFLRHVLELNINK